MTVNDGIAIPEIPDPPVLPPISIMVGAVRVRVVYTWSGARAALHKMITDAYLPNGPMSLPLSPLLRRRMEHELDQVYAGQLDGMIVTSGDWTWADSARVAREGEHGLSAGDLCHLRDVTNGHLGGWTINVKAKILAVNPDSGRVTVRVTDKSASQFTAGTVTTVHADRIRPRRNGGR